MHRLWEGGSRLQVSCLSTPLVSSPLLKEHDSAGRMHPSPCEGPLQTQGKTLTCHKNICTYAKHLFMTSQVLRIGTLCTTTPLLCSCSVVCYEQLVMPMFARCANHLYHDRPLRPGCKNWHVKYHHPSACAAVRWCATRCTRRCPAANRTTSHERKRP